MKLVNYSAAGFLKEHHDSVKEQEDAPSVRYSIQLLWSLSFIEWRRKLAILTGRQFPSGTFLRMPSSNCFTIGRCVVSARGGAGGQIHKN